MAISVAQLKQEVREKSTRDAPGRKFCSSIAELARSGRLSELRGVLPEVLFQELLQLDSGGAIFNIFFDRASS